MEELTITKEMRNKINDYLGYELITENDIGHYIYDEAPGLGKIGIEGGERDDCVTNKLLDAEGNVLWFRHPNSRKREDRDQTDHHKLTTLSAQKAKVVIASLFPDEMFDNGFLKENENEIARLRQELRIVVKKIKGTQRKLQKKIPAALRIYHCMLKGAFHLYSGSDALPSLLQLF